MSVATGSFTDLHNHLVPGVDDGSRSLEDSLEGIGRMVAVGVSRIVTTPHLDASVTVDRLAIGQRLEEVESAWNSLSAAVGEAHPELSLGSGFEIALDLPEPDFDDQRLRLGESRAVLVEWPRMRIPPATPRVLARLVESGVRPVIAHPERYQAGENRLRLAAEWRQAGAVLQLNHGSLLGRYGPQVRSAALRLLRAGLIDLMASDFHGRPHLKLYLEEARERFDKLGASEQFEMLTRVNPLRVLEDQPLMPVPALPDSPGFWGKVKDLFQPGAAS